MSNEAKIVSLSSLMGENIGESPKDVDKKKSDEDLGNAIEGNKEDPNFFKLDDAKKASEELERISEEEAKAKAEALKNEDAPIKEKDKKEISLEDTFNLSEPGKPAIGEAESEVYKKTLKSMFGDSVDSLVQQDEEGNETEVSLDTMTIDEELFNQIVHSKMELIREEASKDKISTKGVSDFAKKLIEIDRNGGDINELIKVKESYADPLDEIDFSTEDGQIQAVYLRLIAGGQDEDTIRRLIESYRSEGSLAQRAQEAEVDLRNAVDQQLEKARLSAEKVQENRKNLLKQYKKDLKTNLGAFQLNENIKSKIVNLATKEDEKGRFELDRLYYQRRENPEDAARLALFLLDEKEYIKQVTNSTVQEKKLDSAKKLKIIMGSQKQTASPQFKDKGDPKKGGDNLMPLDIIANS